MWVNHGYEATSLRSIYKRKILFYLVFLMKYSIDWFMRKTAAVEVCFVGTGN